MANEDDPVMAAQRRMIMTGQSFFPAVNQRMFDDRKDLLNDIDASFYGGGNAPPTPTPTPTPIPRSFLTGGFGSTNPNFIPFRGTPPSLFVNQMKPSGLSFVPRISAEQLALPPRRPFYYNNPTQFDVFQNYTF